MTKGFLIATVAAFAITAPAQAEEQRERRSSSEQQAKQKRGDRQAVRSKVQARSGERRQQRMRADRPRIAKQARVERRGAASQLRERREQRVERARPQRIERQARSQRIERQGRSQRIERQARNQRLDRQVRSQRIERQARNSRIERQARNPRIERQARNPRIERQARSQRIERQARNQRFERQARQRIERQARNQRIERRENRGLERAAFVQNRNRERFEAKRELQLQRQLTRQGQRFDPRDLRNNQKRSLAQLVRPSRDIGERIDLRQRQVSRDWFDDYVARRYTRTAPSSRYVYDYDYDDGYLYKVDRETSAVAALMPLLGGAFSVAQPLPVGYQNYNVPSAYRSLYYDTPNYQYRYGSGAIYRVDPETQLVQSVVALLTGQNLGVGQMLPAGYDVYNVPYAYRDRFADSDDTWFRYSDGHIYGVDPYSRQIQSMYPVNYGGYNVGYQVPSYASYGGYTGYGSYGGYPSYSVPQGYQNLYYGQPGYNYHYANNGIYQVDPTTQLISALVALVTGTNLGIGQQLPRGYDVYNVPSAYRATYFDTPQAMYRYDDGYIYQVDPRSRIIQASIPVSYDGYMVGQPIPAAYPGYTVPNQYSGLYNPAPGYDYRYFDGGIYAVNPQTQIVQSQVALLTGNTFGVGQMLPAGYDVYNVPFAYRDRYYDSPQSMYRYADGRIYQVDPTTRLIQAVIDAIV